MTQGLQWSEEAVILLDGEMVSVFQEATFAVRSTHADGDPRVIVFPKAYAITNPDAPKDKALAVQVLERLATQDVSVARW